MNKQFIKRITAGVLASCLLMGTAFAGEAYELTLDESIRLALANNPAIKVAEAELEQADWAVLAARSGKGVTLSVNHNSGRGRISEKSSTANDFKNNLSLSLPLYTGGKVESTIKQAKLGNESAAFNMENVKQQVRLDATNAYYNLLQTANMFKLSQESVDRLEAHLKNVQAQFQVGIVAKTDVLRSEVEVADAEQSFIKAESAYQLAIANLNNVLGLPLDTEISVKDQLGYEQIDLTLEQSLSAALLNRPELAQAGLQVEAATAGVNIAKSGFRPTVAVSANEGWTDNSFPGTDDNNWSVGVSVNWNLLDSGLTNSQVKQAKATLTKSMQQQQQVKDSVQLEVRQAYLNLKEAEKRIATSQVTVVKAEEDYKIAQVRYTSGVGTNLDVIDSQVALSQAKINYVQSLYDYNTSRAKLDKAMGRSVADN